MTKSKPEIYLEYLLLCVTVKLSNYFKLYHNSFIHTVISRLFKILIPSLYNISLHNLKLAFPNHDLQTVKTIQTECYTHLTTTLFEITALSSFYIKYFKEWVYYNSDSVDFVENEYRKGKGVLIVTAHYGNWEILALAIARLNKPFNIIYRPLDNPLLDRYMYKIRESYPAKLIKREETLKKGIAALKNGDILAITIDQNQKENPIFVPFFNYPAATAKGAAILARRSKASVFFADIQRNNDFTHKVRFKPIDCNFSSSVSNDIYENTKMFTGCLEKTIINKPEQWFWFHPRWKTRPEEFNL